MVLSGLPTASAPLAGVVARMPSDRAYQGVLSLRTPRILVDDVLVVVDSVRDSQLVGCRFRVTGVASGSFAVVRMVRLELLEGSPSSKSRGYRPWEGRRNGRGGISEMNGAEADAEWTVFSVREVFSGVVRVVAVVPGNQENVAVCPSSDAVLVPQMHVVAASSAWEAAGLIAYGSDGSDGVEPLSTSMVTCRDCARFEGSPSMALRNAMGHDKFGHRLSNNLSRAGVTSIAELRLISDGALLSLRDFGSAGLRRVHLARLGRVSSVDR
ncbi:DUF6093 family protein [Streptomyces sp. NPDC004752]